MSSIENITQNLEKIFELQHANRQQGLEEKLIVLQQWQCKRLSITYDFLYQKKKFGPAISFFLEELYGPRRYNQRDEDLHKIIPKMATCGYRYC